MNQDCRGLSVALLIVAAFSTGAQAAEEPATAAGPTGISELADLCLTTTLAEDGRPKCVVVIPDQPHLRALAERIRAKVQECSGVSLSIRSDSESLDVLDSDNAIAVGCLPNNRLIEKLYLDWFTLCDRWYPGPRGWLIRTIHNPYGTGKNVILLGASQDEMLTSAVEAFCVRLKPGKTCQVDRIWDIHLGEGMELNPDVDSTGLFHLFNDADQGIGLSKVFQQGLRYWYTGDETYAEKFMAAIAANPGQIVTADHYNSHKHPLIWDVIEESPSFTDRQRLQVVNGLLRHLRGGEALAAPGIKSWLDAKNPKRMMERHGMMSAICALDGARYFQAHYPSPEFADALETVDKYFARQMTHGKGWKDELDLHTYFEMPLLYALFRRNSTFRESGAMELFADRCVQYCSNLGGMESYPFYVLRMAAHMLDDPGYTYVADMRLRAEERHGPLPVHEFVGPRAFAGDGKPAPPRRHVGVLATPVDPIEHWVYDYRLPIEKGFDKFTLRAGFEIDDDYLLLDGVSRVDDKANYDAMSVKEFSASGRVFLSDYTNCTILARHGFTHHNLVTVTRDGQAELPPRLAELVHTAKLGGFGYAHARMDPYIDSVYDRRLIWKANRWLVVCDRLEANQTGDYALACNWSLPGKGEEEDGVYHTTIESEGTSQTCWIKCAQRHPLRVRRSSIPFPAYVETKFAYFGYDLTRVAQMACGQLQEGETREFTNLIHVSGKDRPGNLDLRSVQPGLAVLSGEETAFLVSGSPLDCPDAGLQLEADAAVLTDGLAVLFACRRFAWHDLQIQSSKPVDVDWNMTDGEMYVDAQEESHLRIVGTTKVVIDGKAVLLEPGGEMIRVDLSEGGHHLSGLAASLPERRRQDIALAARAAAGPSTSPDRIEAVDTAKPLWEATLPAPVASLEVAQSPDGLLVLAGDKQGTVHALRDGRTVWSFATGGAVECMAVGPLDEAQAALLVGSDDEHLYRLGLDGREAWRLKMGGDYSYDWWTLGNKSLVRAILIADLRGDGTRQIVVGHGGAQLELADAAGKSLWQRTWQWGVPATLASVDCDGDGVQEIMTGGRIRSCTSYVKSYSADGTPLHGALYGEGQGRTSRGFDCAGVPFLRYFREGDALRAVVARSGPYCDLGLYDHKSQKLLWKRVVGDTVSGVLRADLDADDLPEIVYSTEAGWVATVDRSGKSLWTRQLTDAVSALRQSGELIVAASRDGRLHFLDKRGTLRKISIIPPGKALLAPAMHGAKPALAAASGNRIALYQP